jgi:hypothetical protein
VRLSLAFALAGFTLLGLLESAHLAFYWHSLGRPFTFAEVYLRQGAHLSIFALCVPAMTRWAERFPLEWPREGSPRAPVGRRRDHRAPRRPAPSSSARWISTRMPSPFPEISSLSIAAELSSRTTVPTPRPGRKATPRGGRNPGYLAYIWFDIGLGLLGSFSCHQGGSTRSRRIRVS